MAIYLFFKKIEQVVPLEALVWSFSFGSASKTGGCLVLVLGASQRWCGPHRVCAVCVKLKTAQGRIAKWDFIMFVPGRFMLDKMIRALVQGIRITASNYLFYFLYPIIIFYGDLISSSLPPGHPASAYSIACVAIGRSGRVDPHGGSPLVQVAERPNRCRQVAQQPTREQGRRSLSIITYVRMYRWVFAIKMRMGRWALKP